MEKSTKRRNIEESLIIYNEEKKEVIIKTIKTKREGQCEQEKTGEQLIRKEVIANQKQTLNNKTPEERTRNQTSQRNLNEYVILKEKNNKENTNATTQQNSKPNREDEKELNQVEGEGRYEDKQNQKLNKEKVKEKDEAGYKDNDSTIGKTGSTTENNEKTNIQNEEQDGKQIEKGQMEKGKTKKKSKREIMKKDRIRNQKHAKDVKNM